MLIVYYIALYCTDDRLRKSLVLQQHLGYCVNFGTNDPNGHIVPGIVTETFYLFSNALHTSPGRTLPINRLSPEFQGVIPLSPIKIVMWHKYQSLQR